MKIRIEEWGFQINPQTRVDLMATGEELKALIEQINQILDTSRTDWNYIIQLGYKRNAPKEKNP